jgi:hypothetical protein
MKSSRERWFERLRAERERRREAALMVDGQNPREAFVARLTLIGERLRSSPDFVEPTADQKKQWRKEIDALFGKLFPGRYGR